MAEPSVGTEFGQVGAVKNDAHARVQGKVLKFCDADCFGLVAGFGTDHYSRDLFN